MRNRLCLPGAPFDGAVPDPRGIPRSNVVVVIIVLGFAGTLLYGGFNVASAITVTGAVTTAAAVLVRRLTR